MGQGAGVLSSALLTVAHPAGLPSSRVLATPVIYESERHISQLGYESCGTELVPIGTVLISSRAPIGHVAIAGVQLCTNQGCKSFIPGALIDSNYLYFALKSSVPRIRELGSGATFAEVSKATLGTFPIALPMLDEQRRIASELAKKIRLAENLNAAAGAELQGFRSVPAELLRRAFSGEVENSLAFAFGALKESGR